MRRRFIVILLAGCVSALPGVANAAPAPIHSASARRAGERALDSVRDTLAGERRKAAPHVTSLMKQMAVALPALSGRERTQAERLLARPGNDAQPGENAYAVPEHSPPFCSLHFCIHWVDSTVDAPPLTDSNSNGVPDYVEQMSSVFEHVYQVENVQMGWRTPLSDGTRGGGNGQVDVYLADIGNDGIYGYSAPDPGQLGNSQMGYLVMDNDYSQSQYHRYSDPLPPMEVTAAHEYNHVLQFTYDLFEDTWMMESSAVWMEDKVYSAVNDYVSYLYPWSDMTRVPLTRFNGSDPSDDLNIKVYGDIVWNRWLEAHYGQDAIRRAWERSAHVTPGSFAPAAYQAALSPHGTTFFRAFARFAADTAEWSSPGSVFTEGGTWPQVGRVSGQALAPLSGRISGHLDHTAYELVNVTPTHDARIKLVATLPHGVAGAFALVGARGGGAPVVHLRDRLHGGRATVTLDNPGSYTRITAVLINADATQDGYSQDSGDWRWARDHKAVSAFVSNDFTPPLVRSRSPRPGRRGVSRRASIVVAFTEPVGGVNTRTVKLVGPRGRSVAVRVRYDAQHHRLRLIPRHRLAPHAHYVVKLGSKIVDGADNSLPTKQRAWTFRT